MSGKTGPFFCAEMGPAAYAELINSMRHPQVGYRDTDNGVESALFDGKLPAGWRDSPVIIEEEPAAAPPPPVIPDMPIDTDLEALSRDELVEFARMHKFPKPKGNASAETIRADLELARDLREADGYE